MSKRLKVGEQVRPRPPWEYHEPTADEIMELARELGKRAARTGNEVQARTRDGL